MADNGNEITVFQHYRIVMITLSTTFAKLYELVQAALKANNDEQSLGKIHYIGLYCAGDVISIRDGVNHASNLRTLEAKVEKIIPARDAFDNIYVKASTGTPTMSVELYFG
jgi:cbb3-type cytochrome oxidase cytochrome c subunit